MKLSYRLVLATFVLFLAAGPGYLALAQTRNAADKAARVDALFREYDRPDVPGASVIVIRNGKVLFKKAFGLANLEDKTRRLQKVTTGSRHAQSSLQQWPS